MSQPQCNKRILWKILGAAVIVRLLAAYFVYGPQALDDYKHGVLPAYQWWAGLTVELPEYRSFLLTWLLGGFLKVGELFGALTPLAQAHAMYIGLALISLLAFVGPFLYARTFTEQRFAYVWLWLLAIFPLMPFVSTRAFGESVALPFVLSGLCLAEVGRKENRRDFMAIGLLTLGVATLFRFQVGIIYFVYLFGLLKDKNWRQILVGVGCGVLLLGAAGLVDWLSGRSAFATLLHYLNVNKTGAAEYGVSPWYNTWLLALGLTLFPFSLAFIPDLKEMWRRHWRLLLPLLCFVFIHSMIPHKEERFLYPIVGLILLVIAEGLTLGKGRFFVDKVYGPFLKGMTAIGLLITCFNNTQVGEIGPAAVITSHYENVLLLDRQSLLAASEHRDYLVRPPNSFVSWPTALDEAAVTEQFKAQIQFSTVAILTSQTEIKEELEALAHQQNDVFKCGDVEAASSMVDALIYKMNPKHNKRRRPTWYLVCERRLG